MRAAVALLFSRTLVTAAAVTPLLCLALAGRRWLEKRFAPKARKFLWWGLGLLLIVGAVYPGMRTVSPAVRVEVPAYTVTLPVPRQEVKAPEALPPQGAGTAPGTAPEKTTAITPLVPVTPEPAPAAQRVALMDLLAWVWAVGAVAMGLFQAVQYLVTRRKWIKQSRRLEDGLEAQWQTLAAELGVRAEFRVLAGLDGPVTLGLVRPVVFLPEGEVHPMAVRHELTHVAQRDLWLKWLLLLDRAVYWFHPLVWLALPAAGIDIEAACDAKVVEGLGAEEKRAYGELLLSAAAGRKGAAYATRFGGGAEQMRSRLTQIFCPGRAGRAVFAVALAVTLLSAALVACESSGTLADGTYYATYDVFETMKKDDYDAVEVSLVDYHPEGNWFVPQEKTVTLPLAEKLVLQGQPMEGGRVKPIWEFLMWPMLRSTAYLGCDDVLELRVSGGEVTEMVRHEGARGVVGPVYENAQKDFSLRLPESWNGSVLAVERSINAPGWAVDFYDAELYREGQEDGALLQVYLYPAEVTDLTARMKPAGRSHGWWAYYVWPQTRAVEDEAVRDRYNQMYDDGLKLTEEDFAALGGEAAEDDALYVNTQHGFSLRLPESWAGQYRAEESGGGTVIDFYQIQQEEHPDRFLMSLVITSPEDFRELYGDKDLDGMYANGGPWIKVLYEGSDVIYAHIDAAAFPETPGDEWEERCLTMVRDAIAELGPEDFTLTGGEGAAETPTPTQTLTLILEPADDPYAWRHAPDAIEDHVTIEGFYHRPFEELPQELRDSLTWDGEVKTEQGYSFRLRTYTAPGIEIVTTEAPPEVLDRYRDSILGNYEDSGPDLVEDWDGSGEMRSKKDFEAEIEAEKGREWLYSVTVTDDAYATKYGLKVGLTVAEAEALGYPLSEELRFGVSWANNLIVTVEEDRVTQLHVWWGMGRYVGRYWDI